jgi:hypothetical protein
VPLGFVQFVLLVDEQVTVGTTGFVKVVEHVAVHPDVVLVTITVYVPADKPVKLVLVDPLLHKYETAVELALAVPFPAPEQTVLFVNVHVTEGTIGSAIIAEQVAVQPEPSLVTVTVYVPADKPLMAALVDPVLHRNVTPVEFAVAVPLPPPVQFVLFVEEHESEGIAGLLNVVEQVAEHPELMLVTVTV